MVVVQPVLGAGGGAENLQIPGHRPVTPAFHLLGGTHEPYVPHCTAVRWHLPFFAGWGLQHRRQALSHSLAFQTVSETVSPHPLGTQLLPC